MADTVEGAEDFLQELDKRWHLLFCDTHMADRFQLFDMAESRARENSTATPAPGTAVPQMDKEEEAENPEPSWVCDLEDDARPGVACGAVFASFRALAMHRRRAHNFGFFDDGSLSMLVQTAARYFPAGPQQFAT